MFKWINENDKQIFFVDYSKCKKVDETLILLENANQEIKNLEDELFILINLENAPVSKDFLMKSIQAENSILSKLRIKKRAVYGLDGTKKFLFRSFSALAKNNIEVFNSYESALIWLNKNEN